MEYYTTITLLIIIFTIIFFSKKPSFSKSKLPPGPKPWPIIGNILQLGTKPHQSLTELSKFYGPIMSLKLGSITTIVISSPEIAKEMFLKHDLTFSGRCVLDSITTLKHHEFSIVFLPVCPRWKKLRKIATIHLFTSQRLDATEALRYTKINELVEYVRQCCVTGAPVDIGKAAFITSLNLLSNTIFSMDLASHTSSNPQEFKDIVQNLLVEGARPNISDFLPALKKLDLQGVSRRAKHYSRKMLRVFEEIIGRRLNDSMDAKDDVLGTLLKLVENGELNMDEVKFLLMDLFIAGTDTSTVVLEWAMTELLRHPEKMIKGQTELDQIFAKDGCIHESNILKLSYIQAIVKETYRLHPPVPFLVPHKAEKDVELSGYYVPKGTQVWVNLWSIGRNANVWPNPFSFSPERFLEKEIDVKGRDFELIPFGAGRRICPGIPLGYRMVHMMLATLLHSFRWKCCVGVSPEDINMEEKFGITLMKAQPLEAIPCLR